MFFVGFFKFLIFYENNTNFSLSNSYALIKNISERNKIDTQSRADAYIRRKRLISKSDYNLKSGCT